MALYRGLTTLVYAHKLLVFALHINILFLHAYGVCGANVHVTKLSEMLKCQYKCKYHNNTTSRRDCCTESTQIIDNTDSKIPPRAFPPTSGSFTDHNERTQNVNLLLN